MRMLLIPNNDSDIHILLFDTLGLSTQFKIFHHLETSIVH